MFAQKARDDKVKGQSALTSRHQSKPLVEPYHHGTVSHTQRGAKGGAGTFKMIENVETFRRSAEYQNNMYELMRVDKVEDAQYF